MNKTFVIYKYTNLINNKVYIGQTCQNPPNKRWYPSNYIHNEYLYNSIQKYGWDNFSKEIIEKDLTLEEANEREEFWIQYYKTLNREYGYNIRPGGNNSLLSDETKNKMSINHRDVKGANNYFYNKKLIGKDHPFYGKHHSDKSKEKISKNRLNKGGKKVLCITTGEIFPTASEAGRHYSINSSHISECCRGVRKSCGDKQWKYI